MDLQEFAPDFEAELVAKRCVKPEVRLGRAEDFAIEEQLKQAANRMRCKGFIYG